MATRRRVLSIIAGFAIAPARASAASIWQGRAMGAEARVILARPPAGSAYAVFRKIEHVIAQVEQHFSLHADSELQQLNSTGLLRNPSSAMCRMVALSDRVHAATDGIFDPTIQPLWLALAKGRNPAAARKLVGWDRVRVDADGITLARGTQLTFNGIAQGYCADRVADVLRSEGFDHVLVDTGELSAVGPALEGEGWPVTIAGPDGAALQHMPLANRALATSSPAGLRLAGGEPHILGPAGEAPRWNTVSVSARSAAVADALSTAACLMTRPAINQALLHFPDARIEVID